VWSWRTRDLFGDGGLLRLGDSEHSLDGEWSMIEGVM